MSGRLIQVLSLGCLAGGIVLLAIYGHHRYSSASGQQEGLDRFAAARAAQRETATLHATRPPEVAAESATADTTGSLAPRLPPLETGGGSGRQAPPDTSQWSQQRIDAYETLQHADPDLPEGILRIPSVDLEVPVFSGTGEPALTRGAGRIEGTPRVGQPGNTGIAAHRDGWFRALKDVRVGDAVEVQTLDGDIRFQVTETFVVDPDDIEVLSPTGHDSLTLVTCYPFYFVGAAPQRYIIRAERR